MSKREAGSKEYAYVLGLVTLMVFAVAWVTNFLIFDPQIIVGLTGHMREFDSNEWKINQHRQDMVANLILSGRLNGLTHSQVDELLGAQKPPPNKVVEALGVTGWGVDITGDYWLMIFYDENGHVNKVRIKYCGS